MNVKRVLLRGGCVLTAVCFLLGAAPAPADTIAWTHWNSGTAGSPGSASGNIGSISVTYSGETNGLLTGYPSWTPTATFAGGLVGNAPPAADNSVKITGGVPTLTETITFSSPIVDPVMAIWSLGQPGLASSFNFTSSEPFSIVAGGKSAEFGGSTITKSGNNVLGSEGNGTIIFDGTFSSLTFTTPVFENYYAFTVGYDATLTGGGSPVPEPGALALLGTGLAAIAAVRRKVVKHG